MGVLLSRKSEARSIITGNSVSSSNSCLVTVVVTRMVMMTMRMTMKTMLSTGSSPAGNGRVVGSSTGNQKKPPVISINVKTLRLW